MKKYKLLKKDLIQMGGKTLCRIQSLRDFSNVKTGDLGGYVESEENLSHDGNCWIYDNAKVYGVSEVFNNALVYGDAEISEFATVFGDAEVYGDDIVSSNN